MVSASGIWPSLSLLCFLFNVQPCCRFRQDSFKREHEFMSHPETLNRLQPPLKSLPSSVPDNVSRSLLIFKSLKLSKNSRRSWENERSVLVLCTPVFRSSGVVIRTWLTGVVLQTSMSLLTTAARHGERSLRRTLTLHSQKSSRSICSAYSPSLRSYFLSCWLRFPKTRPPKGHGVTPVSRACRV